MPKLAKNANAQLIALKTALKKMGPYAWVSLHGFVDPIRNSWESKWMYDITITNGAASTSPAREKIEIGGFKGFFGAGHTSEKEAFSSDQGSFGTYRAERYTETYLPTSGIWSPLDAEMLLGILDLLPTDSELYFTVSLDAGTSDLCVPSGIHVDKLYMEARFQRNGKEVRKKFLLSSVASKHNTARFGNPNHENDRNGRAA